MENDNTLTQNADEFICSNCGTGIAESDEFCTGCGVDLKDRKLLKKVKLTDKPIQSVDQLLETQQSPSTTATTPQPDSLPGEGAISGLKFFAWFDLVVSIIIAIIIWAGHSTLEVSSGYYSTKTVVNYTAVGLGFGIFFQGMFACSLFLVIASIAENLFILRKNSQ